MNPERCAPASLIGDPLQAEVLHEPHRVKKERVGKVARQEDRTDDVKSPATFLLCLGHFASLIRSLHVISPPPLPNPAAAKTAAFPMGHAVLPVVIARPWSSQTRPGLDR